MAQVTPVVPSLPFPDGSPESIAQFCQQVYLILNGLGLAGAQAFGPLVLAKLLPVDGPASLLDADLLDGKEGVFYQDAANLISGLLALARLPTVLTGKDADLLDGQHGAYYQDAANLNAGVLNEARVPFEAPGPIGVTTPDDIRAKRFEANPGPSVLAFNAYFSGGWKYRADGNAAMIEFRPSSENGGRLTFSLAPPGTVGGAISFTTSFDMKLADKVIEVGSGWTITKEGESWTGLSFQNNWANQGGLWQTAQYIKDASGYVHVRGVIKRAVAYADTVVGTLPTGYRPVAERLWRTTDPGRWSIRANGEFFIQGGGASYMTLDGITFEAA